MLDDDVIPNLEWYERMGRCVVPFCLEFLGSPGSLLQHAVLLPFRGEATAMDWQSISDASTINGLRWRGAAQSRGIPE